MTTDEEQLGTAADVLNEALDACEELMLEAFPGQRVAVVLEYGTLLYDPSRPDALVYIPPRYEPLGVPLRSASLRARIEAVEVLPKLWRRLHEARGIATHHAMVAAVAAATHRLRVFIAVKAELNQ